MKREDVETAIEYLPRPRPGGPHPGSGKPAILRVFYLGTDSEEVFVTFRVPMPPRGQYKLEFDLVSEGVAWFALNGSQPVVMDVTVE